MRHNSINIWILPMLIYMLMTAVTASAQEGLHVDKAFRQFGRVKGCKMVELNDATLKGYKLHVYKSLIYKKVGDSIDALMKEDKRKAKKIREVVESGRLMSGYYMMPPLDNGMNRFILFSRAGNLSGTVIYIEGRLGPDDIMKLCYARW